VIFLKPISRSMRRKRWRGEKVEWMDEGKEGRFVFLFDM